MKLFEPTIRDLHSFIKDNGPALSWRPCTDNAWPAGGNRNIVLAGQVGVELGSPEMDSISSLIWTQDDSLVDNGRITLIGPDLDTCRHMSIPFGCIVLARVQGMNEENAYERYREMEHLKYGLDLKGYMLRAVSGYQKLWCRISVDALDSGFSLDTLGASLMRLFYSLPYVISVEILFITSSRTHITALNDMTINVSRIMQAMNKMATELSFDCSECEYQDVCNDALALKDMRKTYIERSGGVNHG